jgi:hypothetical protein
MSYVKVGGVWHTPGNVYAKVGGVWHTGGTVYEKVAGVWRVTTLGIPPTAPITGYVSNLVFSVTNPVANAVYTPTLLTGTGTATWNGTLNQFTLTGATARFSVTAGWASNAPQSTAAYMDHQPLVNDVYHSDYVCTNQTFDNCGPPGQQCGCGTFNGCGDGVNCCGWVCHAGYYNNYYTLNYTPQGSGYTQGTNEWWKVS